MKLESIVCDLCGGLDNISLFHARDYRFGHGEIFNIVRCISCGLIYLNPRPTSDVIIKLYEEDYTPENDQNVLPKLEENHWKAYMRKIGRKIVGSYTDEIVDQSAGKVLDIGCGRGYLLQSLKQKGCEVFGVEANQNSVDICHNLGLIVFHGNLEEAHYPDNFFDTVVLSQVLEHLPSPQKTLREIWRILKSGGNLFIYTPNPKGYMAKVFGKYWHGWHIPFHFYALTAETMRKLAEETGFAINKISTITPTRFFIVSLKSYLWGDKISNIRPIEKGRFFESSLFIIFISPLFRILDLFLPQKGDCLRVIMTKGNG